MRTQPLKATLLDDDAFRLLALPFGGPIPYPGAPRGADLDRQWLSDGTDFGRPPKAVEVTWHHGLESPEVIGKAGNLTYDDDGGWVDVWLDHGRRRVQLIRRLAQRATDDPDPDLGVFGSSESELGTARIRTGKAVLPWRRDIPGEIAVWHYIGQTLSTSPQNTQSILAPMKATLSELASGTLDPTADFFDDLTTFMDTLAPSSDRPGKAGRVLAARNEARLREAREHIDEAYFDPKRRRAALALLDDVFRELDQYIHDT